MEPLFDSKELSGKFGFGRTATAHMARQPPKTSAESPKKGALGTKGWK